MDSSTLRLSRIALTLFFSWGLFGGAISMKAQCRDPWVSQAVREVLNRPAQGQGDTGECNYRNYGGGSWSNYPDLKQKVIVALTGVCRDPWVTQAVTEVRGRKPQGYGDTGECNYRNYGGGTWSSYPDLKQKVQRAFGITTAPPPPAPAPPPATPAQPVRTSPATAGSNPTLMTMIANQYITDFGRNMTDAERAYWSAQAASDARLRDAATFQQNNLAYLRTSAAERQNLIITAYRATWGVNMTSASKEVQLWDQQVAQGKIGYSSVKHALDQLKAANPAYVPGQTLTAALKPPATYSVQTLGDDLWRLPLNFVIGTLNTALSVPATIMDAGRIIPGVRAEGVYGPPPPAAPSAPPAPLPPPPVQAHPVRNLFSGPFIIAATNNNDSTIAMCLDKQSWKAGAPLVAARCHGGDSQLFWIDNGHLVSLVRDGNNALCIDGAGGKRQLVMNVCSAADTQRWYTNTIPGSAAGYPVEDYWDNTANQNRHSSGQIQNVANRLCIDIQGASTNNPTPVIAWDCQVMKIDNQRSWNQIWGAGHMMRSGGAYVFMRYYPAPAGAGHVAWAVQLEDGSWEAGGIDGKSDPIIRKGTSNGAIRKHFNTEVDVRKYFGIEPSTGAGRFDRYWRWTVPGPVNSAAVFSLESQYWDWGYGVFGNNCLDSTWSVLRAYGLTSLYKPPSIGSIAEFAPSIWFGNVMKSLNTEAKWLHGACGRVDAHNYAMDCVQ